MSFSFEKNELSWNGKIVKFNAEIFDVIPYKDMLIVLVKYHRYLEFINSDIKTSMNRNIICLNPDMTLKWEIFDMTDIFRDKNGKKSQTELPYLKMYFEGEKFICESWWGGGELIDPETGIRLGKAFSGR